MFGTIRRVHFVSTLVLCLISQIAYSYTYTVNGRFNGAVNYSFDLNNANWIPNGIFRDQPVVGGFSYTYDVDERIFKQTSFYVDIAGYKWIGKRYGRALSLLDIRTGVHGDNFSIFMHDNEINSPINVSGPLYSNFDLDGFSRDFIDDTQILEIDGRNQYEFINSDFDKSQYTSTNNYILHRGDVGTSTIRYTVHDFDIIDSYNPNHSTNIVPQFTESEKTRARVLHAASGGMALASQQLGYAAGLINKGLQTTATGIFGIANHKLGTACNASLGQSETVCTAAAISSGLNTAIASYDAYVSRNPLSLFFDSISNTNAYMRDRFEEIINDPPDFDFENIADFQYDRIDFTLGNTDEAILVANEILNLTFEAAEALEVALHSMERSQGAAIVGESAWEATQKQQYDLAMQIYDEKSQLLAQAYEQYYGTQSVIDLLASVSANEDLIKSALNDMHLNGLSEEDTQTLTALGHDDPTAFIASMYDSLYTKDFNEFIHQSQTFDETLAMETFRTSAVPVPPAVWLFASGLIGMISIARRRK